MAKPKRKPPAKSPRQRTTRIEPRQSGEGDPWGDQELYSSSKSSGAPYTPQETGSPDETIPEPNNPQGVQGGRGPLAEEGEGDRQNDQLAELQEQEIDVKDETGRPDEDV